MNKSALITTISVALIFALRMLGLFTVLPVLAGHFSNVKLVGLAIGIYGLSQAILQIPLGILSDRVGRKAIIFAGLILFIIGSIIAALNTNIYGVIIGRALQGSAAIGCVLLALVADVVEDKLRPRAMAIVGIGIALSFAIAMAIGPLLYRLINLSGMFYLMAILGLLAMVLLLKLPKQSQHQYLQNNTGLVKVLLNKKLVSCNIGVMLLHAMLAAWFVFLPVVFKGYSANSYIMIILGSFGSAIIALRYVEKYNKLKVGLIISVILLLISQLILISDIDGVFIIGVTIFMAAFNFLEANLPMLVAKFANRENRGAALGVHSSMQFFGTFLGGMLGGVLL